MPKKEIGYNTTVTSGMAKDVTETSQLNTEARERYATGTNEQKRYTAKAKPFGKLGKQGHPS